MTLSYLAHVWTGLVTAHLSFSLHFLVTQYPKHLASYLAYYNDAIIFAAVLGCTEVLSSLMRSFLSCFMFCVLWSQTNDHGAVKMLVSMCLCLICDFFNCRIFPFLWASERFRPCAPFSLWVVFSLLLVQTDKSESFPFKRHILMCRRHI